MIIGDIDDRVSVMLYRRPCSHTASSDIGEVCSQRQISIDKVRTRLLIEEVPRTSPTIEYVTLGSS